MRYLVLFLFSISLIFGKSEQLIVDAQNFKANDKKGISVFTGDVKIKMGKDKLNAQKVEIYFGTDEKTKAKVAKKYIATGDVDFVIVTEKKHYVGKGNKIIYSPLKEEYTVLGNGVLEEKVDDRQIFGETIYVNQLTGEAKVSGSKNKPVRFIINIQRGNK